MKKLLLVTSLITVMGTTALSSDITSSLKSIENEIKLLNQKEKNRFASEEKNYEAAKKNYSQYITMINTTNERIANLESAIAVSFFPNEYKQLLNNYKEMDKQLRNKAASEEMKIQEFEQLKAILGY